MADILISHVNDDNGRIEQLVQLLAAKNWTIWWNKEIAPGEPVDMATEAELDQASVVITIWSNHSVQSRLVRNTAFEAIESHRWLPLIFDFVRPPLRYRDYQSINMAGWPDQQRPDAERSLLESCQSLLEGSELDGLSTKTAVAQSYAEAGKTVDRYNRKNGSDTNSDSGSSRSTKFATIQLNEWTIEEGQNRLTRDNQIKKITPRSMQVLMYLLENGKVPTSIERILSHVWRDRVVVESVVHRCISELREALEDDFREPKYIETITKRGYRIVASISEVDVLVGVASD